MKRRDFVKGVAATQLAMLAGARSLGKAGNLLAGELSGPMPAPAGAKRLNVVVHGMFMIALDNSGVYLTAPFVGGKCAHEYHAQAFLPDNADPKNVTQVFDYQRQAPTDRVDFKNTSAANPGVALGERHRLAVNLTGTPRNGTPPYWVVSLPTPDDIWPLREAVINYFDANTLVDDGVLINATYPKSEMDTYLQTMPLIYVLSYRNVTSAVTFYGNNQPQDVPLGSDGVYRLHFYAEPSSNCVDTMHTALLALDNMYSPPLTLRFPKGETQGDDPVPRDDAIPNNLTGVRLAEERSLYELTHFDKSFQRFLKEVPLMKTRYSNLIQLKNYVEDRLKDKAVAKAAPFPVFGGPGDVKPPSNCMSLIGITT